GYLLLGTSESVAGRPDFRAVDAKAKVYAYVPAGPKSTAEPDPPAPAAYQRPSRPTPRRLSLTEGRNGESALRAIVEHLLPPSLVIDGDGTLVHAFGDVRAYMRPPTGYRLDLNVTKVVREELALTVSAAVRRTLDENETVIYRGIVIGTGEERRAVSLHSSPLWDPVARQRLAVVALSSTDPPEPSANEGETFQLTASAQRHIATLERELQQTRESLQTTIEELETTNEELQSTNEELLAANEELQSTNEELQSVNEELLTVNGEYQEKIRELTALNDDVNNIMRSTEVGIVLLDQERRLRKFTPATQEVVNVLESDIGRPMAHLTHQFPGIDLAVLVDKVIDNLIPLERQIHTAEHRTYVLRIMPYRTHTLQVEGVVMTFIEVTALEQARQAAEQAEAKIYQFVEHAPAALLMLDDAFDCLHASRQWYDLFDVDGADVTGRSFFDLFPEAEPEWRPRFERSLSGTTESSEKDSFRLGDGQQIDLHWELRPWFEEDLDIGGVMLFASSK
ncbi:MAG: PAS domain-containing protein, partial [Bacteroidota bacterium]